MGASPRTIKPASLNILWQTLAKAALRDDLAGMLRALAADALRTDALASDPAALIITWKTRNSFLYERFRQVLSDLRAAESPDLAMLSVAMRELRNLNSRRVVEPPLERGC
jgi:glutamate dehydrogenase